MALFTDGAITSIEDLRAHDTQLLTVANVEGIDVTRKLELAQDEISVQVAGMLARQSAPPGIDQVVVTAPMKLWHAYRTLEMVYRDAYHNQLNDRYSGKRDEYRTLAQWAYEQLMQVGLGIAADPMPQATAPQLGPAGGNLDDGTYYVSVAWTNAAGEEGRCSDPAAIQISGSSFTVQIAGPGGVMGWNVYAGTDTSSMALQNPTPLSPGETWTQPAPLRAGRTAGTGQRPTYCLPVPRIIQRG
ncbi:MAG: hypothetical protein ABI759_25455 [Candidatus Solibacter sp.]